MCVGERERESERNRETWVDAGEIAHRLGHRRVTALFGQIQLSSRPAVNLLQGTVSGNEFSSGMNER